MRVSILCLELLWNDHTENYGRVLQDCSVAITINSKSSKAYYRSALALVALERYEEAVDSCSRCLDFDSTNQPVSSLKAEAEKLRNAQVKKEREKQERIREAEEKRKRLQVAFKVHGILNPKSLKAHTKCRKGTSLSYPIPRERQKWIINPISMRRTQLEAPSSSQPTSCIPNMRPQIRYLTSMRTHPLAII